MDEVCAETYLRVLGDKIDRLIAAAKAGDATPHAALVLQDHYADVCRAICEAHEQASRSGGTGEARIAPAGKASPGARVNRAAVAL